MTLSDLIAKLQELEAKHGGEIEMAVYRDGDIERLDAHPLQAVRELRVCSLYRRVFVEPDDHSAEGPPVQVLTL